MSTARSHYKLGYGSPFVYMKQRIMEISPSLSDLLSSYLSGCKKPSFGNWQHIRHPLLYVIRFWLLSVAEFVALRNKHFDIADLLYDDLMAEKTTSLADISHYCLLPVSYVDNAMGAFETDSLENSRWSRAALKHVKPPVYF